MRSRASMLYGLASLCVGALGAGVYLDSALVRLDLAAVRLLHRVATDDVTALASGITEIAATQTVFTVGALAACSLLLRGNWHGAFSVGLSVVGAQGIVFAIKELVSRARPPASSSLVDAAGHAFPSAHAASSVALYGLLAYILLRRLDGRARLAAAALALAVVASIGLTRIYLGAHYPSDVLAGWLVGAVVAACAWQLARIVPGRVVASG